LAYAFEVTSSTRVLAILVLCAGCGGDSEPELSNATALQCPAPGTLPFRLESHGFHESSSEQIAKENTRIKDEASDVLGNPNGPLANVYLPDDQSPSASLSYAGTKARTMPSLGAFTKPLGGESVSLWFYDEGAAMWNELDRGTTDADGAYAFTANGFVAANAAPVYAMLEADGSCAIHYNYLMPPGSKFVVMDIDGTLTTDDNELILQIADPTHVPAMMTAANTLAQHWAAKGYPIIYLTARPHVFDAESRAWLDMLEFPKGAMITQNGSGGADTYKTLWLQRMITKFGWVPVAAYGNASTDITAYANVAIPLDRTFIVGPLAGMNGTVAIPNMDYTAHIAAFVDAQPDNR
jgi:hypothetical protein